MKLTSEDCQKIRILLANLADAFVWHTSEEGYEYWEGIRERLERKLESGES